MRRKLREVKDELSGAATTRSLAGRWLASVLRHYAYYAVPGNSDRINRFYNESPDSGCALCAGAASTPAALRG